MVILALTCRVTWLNTLIGAIALVPVVVLAWILIDVIQILALMTWRHCV